MVVGDPIRSGTSPPVTAPGVISWPGKMSRYVLVVSPVESVTVKWTRYQYTPGSWVVAGMVNVPAVTPFVGGTNGWLWSLWWKTTDQVNAMGGRAPWSGSVARPANVRVSPAWYLVRLDGRRITGAGGRPFTTLSNASG